MNSNTSHVILYLKESGMDLTDDQYSNTSHVILYRRFYGILEVVKTNSNTSHVILYPIRDSISCSNYQIQIHLMLFFILSALYHLTTFSRFKYISCYSLSHPLVSIGLSRMDSNTSHVILYPNKSCSGRDITGIQIHLMLFFIPRISAFSYITIPQASLYFNILSFFTSRICFPAKFFVSSSYSLYFRDSV